MSGFSVDPELLKTLAQDVSKLSVEITDSTPTVHLDAGEAGFAMLSDALDRFDGHWRSAGQRIGQNLADIGTLIQNAADGYRQTDDSVSKAAAPGGGGQ